MERVASGTACAHKGCKNFARVGHDTCRWHDPRVIELREEAEQARRAALRAAGAA